MVFDTNILIYYLDQKLTPAVREFVDQTIEEGAFISVISRIEVLGWSKHTAETLRKAEEFLIRNLNEFPITEMIVQRCIALRQQYAIKLPDAIIAATSLRLQLPLITRNTDDFKSIEGLQLINPFDLPEQNASSPSADSDSTTL